MTFTSIHDLNETVTLPDGKVGTITKVTFTSATSPTYTVTIPAHTEPVPESEEETQLDG